MTDEQTASMTRMIGTAISKLSESCTGNRICCFSLVIWLACAKYLPGLSNAQAEKLWTLDTRGLFVSLQCCSVKVSRCGCGNAFCFQSLYKYSNYFVFFCFLGNNLQVVTWHNQHVPHQVSVCIRRSSGRRTS